MFARPILWLALSMAVGSFLGGSLPADAVWVVLALLGPTLALVCCLPEDSSRIGSLALLACSVALGASGVAVQRAAVDRHPLRVALERPLADPVRVEACVRGDPQISRIRSG